MVLDKSISVRVLVLAILVMLVLAVVMSWRSVAYVLNESDSAGARMAFQLSQFPEQVRTAITQVNDERQPDAAERFYKVPADVDPTTGGFDEIGEGLYLSVDRERADRGWRYVTGVFPVDGLGHNGILLLNPEFEVAGFWPVDESAVRDKVEDPNAVPEIARKSIHGIAVLEDGSTVFNFDHGASLQRMSACGETIWAEFGLYHHSVTENEGLLWTLRDLGFPAGEDDFEDIFWGETGFVAVDAETGAVAWEASINQVRAANPDLSIFDIPRVTTLGPTENRERLGDEFMADPYHTNDIEPLPAALADRFPMFEAGDLLISTRTLNTVFVMDPDTLQVKWHATGLTRRQHDPDWGADGRITVFDNRMGLGTSQIVAIDVETREREVLFDGTEMGFYTYVRGKHELRESGDLSVVSSQQGHAFEIDGETGDAVFELYSTKPTDPSVNYLITGLTFLPEDALSMEDLQCTAM